MRYGTSRPQGPSASKYNDERPVQPAPYLRDVDESSIWWSPFQPVVPYGPPSVTRPRDWDYPTGYNLSYIQPQVELNNMLRSMRRSWGVLDTIVATRQDQLLRIPWTIQYRDKPSRKSSVVDGVKQFFRKPDGKSSYGQWTRRVLYDLFDIDQPVVYTGNRSAGGKLLTAEVLDGNTIFPLIDDSGRRPDSTPLLVEQYDGSYAARPQPAFQQIIKGLPMLDLDESEIIWGPMHTQPDCPVFGYSPIRQIFTETCEAIRKTLYQLEFWRDGSIPNLIVTVPDAWTPRQIAMFQGHFDALLSGQTDLKSKVRFIPGGMKPFDIKNANGESLWSKRDDLLLRLACYAFSVSPTPFIQQNNRATAKNAQETAQEEGLFPLMSWWKEDIMDEIIQNRSGFEDIEFVFLPRPEVDLLKQAQIHQIQLREGMRSVNEVREELSQEPVADGDTLLIYTGNGAILLGAAARGEVTMSTAPQGSLTPQPPRAENATQRGIAQRMPAAVAKLSHSDVIDAAKPARGHVASQAQQEAGNYPKGHLRLHGLDISIEHAKGTRRAKRNKDGSERWAIASLPAHYGYIRGTMGADGDQLDVFVGRNPDSDRVWVIDQLRGDEFDEHKIMLGYRKLKTALKDYRRSYGADARKRIHAITELSVEELKAWLKAGDMSSPLVGQNIAKLDTVSQATNLLWYDLQTPGTPHVSRKERKRRKRAARQALNVRWKALHA